MSRRRFFAGEGFFLCRSLELLERQDGLVRVKHRQRGRIKSIASPYLLLPPPRVPCSSTAKSSGVDLPKVGTPRLPQDLHRRRSWTSSCPELKNHRFLKLGWSALTPLPLARDLLAEID